MESITAMLSFIFDTIKGYVIGAANVVPGVSGGTMAYLLGIYERLINSVKSFGPETVKLLIGLKFKELAERCDLVFLVSIMLGVLLSFVSLAKVLGWGLEHHPLNIWSIFFGLILASIPSLLRSVKKWTPKCAAMAVAGLVAAGSMAFLTPASESDNVFYLMICGVVAAASMIIPGLSGSFVLLLMGNYKLIMLDSISQLSSGDLAALRVIAPVGVGAVLGIILLSRLLSWLFKQYSDLAMSLIGGFVAGSLAVIWPWKDAVMKTFQKDDGEIKEEIIGFENWRLPDLTASTDWIAIAFCALGIGLLLATERLAQK